LIAIQTNIISIFFYFHRWTNRLRPSPWGCAWSRSCREC